jgi:MerR family copper efflux transcriptional regulator
MLIGEVSRRSGVSARTIRFYESVGVISAATRTSSGYRAYQDRVLEELGFARRSQELGFSLAEIAKLLAVGREGQKPCEPVVAICDRHLAEIERQLEELALLQAELRSTRDRARGACGLTRAGFCAAVMERDQAVTT